MVWNGEEVEAGVRRKGAAAVRYAAAAVAAVVVESADADRLLVTAALKLVQVVGRRADLDSTRWTADMVAQCVDEDGQASEFEV